MKRTDWVTRAEQLVALGEEVPTTSHRVVIGSAL